MERIEIRLEIIDGNYYAVAENLDWGGLDIVIPVELGPQEPYSDDVPF